MSNTTTQYERVLAGDIQPGDRVARTRTADFREVFAVQRNESTVWLRYLNGSRDRPRTDAKWWRVVR